MAELDPGAKHLALHGHNGMQHVQDGPEPWASTRRSLKPSSLNRLVPFHVNLPDSCKFERSRPLLNPL